MKIEVKNPNKLPLYRWRELEALQHTEQYDLKMRTDEQRAKLWASIQQFGFFVPFYIWKYEDRLFIIDGHGRKDVLLLHNVSNARLPGILVEAESLAEAKQKLLVVTSQFGTVTPEGYAGFTAEIGDEWLAEHVHLDVLHFLPPPPPVDDEKRQVSFQAGQNADKEFIPPVSAFTRLGDVYELNAHRLHCGDSRVKEVVDRTLNGAKPRLMVTDPPYGVEYDAGWRSKAMPEKNAATRWEGSDGQVAGEVANDDTADWSEAWANSPAEVAYVYHAGMYTAVVAASLTGTGFELRSQIIWAKSHFAIGRGHYHWKHEPCWYAVKAGSSAKFIGDRTNTTLWEITKTQQSEGLHSTQKPVECMARPIRNHEGDVYDPFLGSGTTLIACEIVGRTCYAQELKPEFVDLSVGRWVDYMKANTKPFEVKRNGVVLTAEELAKFTLVPVPVVESEADVLP